MNKILARICIIITSTAIVKAILDVVTAGLRLPMAFEVIVDIILIAVCASALLDAVDAKTHK